MTSRLSTAKIGRSPRQAEKVGIVLDFLGTEKDPDQVTTVTEIMHLIDMPSGVTSEGWNRETARHFSLDTAMIAVRRNLALMSEADRQSLILLLQQARSLVTAGRDEELDFIQAALEARVAPAEAGRPRQVWLTAIDALIPSPFRAALVVTRGTLSLGTTETFADLSQLLRDRLLARLAEGSLHHEPTKPARLTG
jgi:hypothetical protein